MAACGRGAPLLFQEGIPVQKLKVFCGTCRKDVTVLANGQCESCRRTDKQVMAKPVRSPVYVLHPQQWKAQVF